MNSKSYKNSGSGLIVSRRQFTTKAATALPLIGLIGLSDHVTASVKGENMEKVSGIGGFFFIAENPEELGKWYNDHLGIDLAPQHTGGAPWRQDAGFTVFDPFAKDNTMIPTGKTWMINFRVKNIAKLVDQLRGAGIEVGNIDEFPHGKFATLTDPEGNGIQLWQAPNG